MKAKMRRCPNCKKYFFVDKLSSNQECCNRKCSIEYKQKKKDHDNYIHGTIDRINGCVDL